MSDTYRRDQLVDNADENAEIEDKEEEEDDDSDLDDTSASLGLNKTGDKGSGYHTRNDPSARHQRQTITERRGAIDVRCKSREVVHGFFGPESDDLATFLVYDFHFDATKRARRVASANITFEFSSSIPGGPPPEVYAIAPQGRFTLLPTTQRGSVTKGGGVKASVGQLGLSISGSVKWEKTVSHTMSDETRLVGATVCNEFGKEVGANWVLHENKTTETGVPSFLRAVILLRREDDNEFEGRVTVEVKADWKTEMARLFGSTPKDDPILFDPGLPPTNKLRKSGYNIEDLGSIEVKDFADVTFHNTLTNVIKGDTQA